MVIVGKIKKKICLPYKKCEEEKELDEELGYIPAPSKVWDPYKKKCIKTQFESDCKEDEVYSISDYLCEKKSLCKNGKLIDGVCLCLKNNRLINSEYVKDKCKGGNVINNKCICEYGKKLINGKCKQYLCKEGNIINNKCICKKGKREINGKCIPYLCKGGYIINNKCVCKDNKENINGICKIKCKGGKLINDKCICPERQKFDYDLELNF